VTVKLDIITPSQWGACAPLAEPVLVPRSSRIIFHHTAGHHPELGNPGDESREEAMLYARRIQAFHMDTNGWNDSGHNFLVCRNGLVLVGRWFTVTAIQHRKMVRSAHCPGQNDQIGIEHEHLGTEEMTVAQRNASARLQAWIADQYGRSTVLPVAPHSKYFATSCPANLKDDIASVKALAQQILDGI
jgi:N-acetylmuramoyl-L-alanine amidase